MHQKTLYVFLPLLALTFFGACGKKLKFEQIVDPVVGAMCKRMATCQSAALPNEELCQKAMKEALQPEKNKAMLKVSATQKQLDDCIKNIEAAECASLLGAEPPKGCEFLK